MKPIEYSNLTWRDYILTVRGFSIKRSYEWEHTRALLHMTWAVNRSEKTPYKGIKEFMPLPLTDDQDGGVSEDEIERMRRLMIERTEAFYKDNQ